MRDAATPAVTYAVPDLHGRLDLLEAAVALVAERGGGHVVFLGDYVDRGPASRGCVERLRAGPPPGQTWTTLMGNHEALLLAAATAAPGSTEGNEILCSWMANGGVATINSYQDYTIPDEHVAWIAALPLIRVDEYRVYVHAGLADGVPLDEQTERNLLWDRYPTRDADLGYALRLRDGSTREMHVVHGHTPFRDGPVLLGRRTNLDCGAVWTGRLAVARFDDAVPGGPAEILWVLGPPALPSDDEP